MQLIPGICAVLFAILATFSPRVLIVLGLAALAATLAFACRPIPRR